MKIKYRAPIFIPCGYAKQARGVIKNLVKNGVEVQLIPIETYRNRTTKGFDFSKLINRNVHTKNVVQFCDPSQIVPNLGKYNIITTLFELTGIPPLWVSTINNKFQEVWVPNHFNYTAFKNSGVRHNPYIMPYGIDTEIFKPKESNIKVENQKGFTFVSNFQWGGRKGYDYLLDAYTQEFTSDDDVCLLLKVYGCHTTRDSFDSISNEIRNRWQKPNAPKIIIWWKFIMDEDLPDLYNAANCYVLPSKGEGWGLPYMEAMACGLPTIGTNWSGNLTFMNRKNSFLIKVDRIEDANMGGWYKPPLKWAIISISHLKWLMRYIYEHPKEARRKGSRARRDIVSSYDWNVVIKPYLKRIGELN